MVVGLSVAEAAARYARAGLRVFPVWWAVDGKCACRKPRCSSPGKHPIADLAPHGCTDATTDEATVAGWWDKHPKASVAIATGPESGVWCIDIDAKHDGDAHWRAVCDHAGTDEPRTLTARTGGGGRHLFFRWPSLDVGISNSISAVAPGVDVRGAGGYVLAAPSWHVSGKVYEWLDLDDEDDLRAAIVEPPAWLLARVMDRAPEDGERKPTEPVDAVLDGVGEGQRNAAAARLCGHLVARLVDPEIAWLAMQGWNRRNRPPMDEDELRKVLKSVVRRDAARHPERARDRTDLAQLEQQLEAEERRVSAADALAAEAAQIEKMAVEAQVDHGAKAPPGEVQLEHEVRKKHVAFLRVCLGAPLARWIRSGVEEPQFALVVDDGERVPVGGVAAVMSARQFGLVLYARFGVVLAPVVVKKKWDSVLAALHAILEVEDAVGPHAELLEQVAAYVGDHRAWKVDEEIEERTRLAKQAGGPWLLADSRGEFVCVQTSGMQQWLQVHGSRLSLEEIRRAFRSLGIQSTECWVQVDGRRLRRHYWLVPSGFLTQDGGPNAS